MSETIFRIQKNADNPFVMIDKRIFTDQKLSYRAKGILGYLLSRPDNWVVNMVDVANQSTEGRDAVVTAVNELMKHGYVERIEHRENGRFKSYEYLVYEVPKPVSASDDTAHWKTVNGKSGNGLSGNGKSATTNKDNTNTDNTNTESDTRTNDENQKNGEGLTLDIEQIKTRFAMAGIIPSTGNVLANSETIGQELYQFNQYYAHLYMTESQAYAKLIAWFKRIKDRGNLGQFFKTQESVPAGAANSFVAPLPIRGVAK